MKTKIILISIGMFLLLIFLTYTISADTYEVSFEPTWDGWVKTTNSGGTYHSHNYTDSVLWMYASTGGSNYEWRFFVEWNISTIPIDAHILDVSFTGIQNSYSYCGLNGHTYVYDLDSKPSDEPDNAVGAMNIFNSLDVEFFGPSDWPWNSVGSTCMLNDTCPGGGVTCANWIINPNATLESKLANGWYALGFRRVVNDQFSFRSSEYEYVAIKPRLWVEYEMTAPIITNETPAYGAVDTNLTPALCIDLNQTDGNTMNLSWYWYNATSDGWEMMNQSIGLSNGTYCTNFSNATEPCTAYYWWVQSFDAFGNETSEVYHFTTHCVDPPTGITCSRYNITTINLTFVPMPEYNGTVHTIIRYKEGYIPPTWGEGTLLENTTNSTANLSGLPEATCFAFSMWTYFNTTSGGWLSASRATKICCTAGGDYRICFKDELTYEDINFTYYPNSLATHYLIIHYSDATSDTIEINNDTIEWNPCCGWCVNVSATDNVEYFEVVWNAEFNNSGLANGTCELPTYRRFLTPLVATNVSGVNVVTFYMANLTVYDVDYECMSEGNLTSYHRYDMENTVVKYTFDFVDETGLFRNEPFYNILMSFYVFNSTNAKITIHQEYWSVSKKIYPHLIYERPYSVGVNSSYQNISYIGPAPNHESQYDTIYITTEFREVVLLDEVDITFGWDTDGVGLWLSYSDPELETTNVNFTVRLNNDTGTIVYSKEGDWNEYLFEYPAANQTYHYVLIITVIRNGIPDDVGFNLYAGMSSLIEGGTLEALLIAICGEPPLYDPETGQSIPYVAMIIGFSSAGMLMILIGTGHVGGGVIITGIWMLFLSGLFDYFDSSITLFYIVGTLFIVLGLLILQRGR